MKHTNPAIDTLLKQFGVGQKWKSWTIQILFTFCYNIKTLDAILAQQIPNCMWTVSINSNPASKFCCNLRQLQVSGKKVLRYSVPGQQRLHLISTDLIYAKGRKSFGFKWPLICNFIRWLKLVVTGKNRFKLVVTSIISS